MNPGGFHTMGYLLRFTVASVVILQACCACAATDREQDNDFVACVARAGVPVDLMRPDQLDNCKSRADIPNPGIEVTNAATKAFQSCLLGSAASFDDGVSPASEIAKVALDGCQPELLKYIDALWLAPGAKARMRATPEQSALPVAMRAVLLVRKTVKTPPRPQTPSAKK